MCDLVKFNKLNVLPSQSKAISEQSSQILCCALGKLGFPIVSFFSDNGPVRFVLTNLEWGPRSNFLDILDLSQTNSFEPISLNMPFFR